MNKGNQNTSSIIGDASTADASFIPNLQNLSNDPYVTVSSDSSQFNIWQQFRMSNNFLESTILENYVTQSNLGSSISSYTLQGNFQGWVPTDQIYLSIPITIRASSGRQIKNDGSANLVAQDPAVFLSFMEALQQRILAQDDFPQRTTFAVPSVSLCSDLTELLMPDFALLHIFERIGIYGGNNNQALGRTPMFDLEGMKQVAFDDKFDDVKIQDYGMWGVPVSVMASQYQQPYGENNVLSDEYVSYNFPVDSDSVSSAGTTINREWYKAFGKILMQTSTHNEATRTAVGDTNIADYYTKTINVPLKLSMINSFFKTSQFLPPEFKYKIDLRAQNDFTTIACTDRSQYKGGATCWPNTCIFDAKMSGPPKLIYVSHTLTQPMQDSLNMKWMQYPFLYNYETYEIYDIACNDQSVFQQNISISQQRPTQLTFAIIDTESNFPPDRFGAAQVRGGLANKTIKIDANNLNTQKIDPPAIFSPRISLNLFLEYFSISLSGRKIIEYKNEDGAPTSIPNSYDMIFQSAQQNSYQRYGTSGQTDDATFGQFNIRRGGNRLIVTIAPGMYADKGFMPVDRGATMITVQMKFNGKLATSKKIQIIKKLPEQLCIDVNKNVTSIMWPAVKSNQGFLVQNTVNTQ